MLQSAVVALLGDVQVLEEVGVDEAVHDQRQGVGRVGVQRGAGALLREVGVAREVVRPALLDAQHMPFGHPGLRDRMPRNPRSEEHTSELQSLMRISYAVFCLKKKKTPYIHSIPY